MRILVTGKNGQLGRSIQKIVNNDTKIDNSQNSKDFIFVGREELDLSSKINISYYFNNNDKFDIIINCAAYTAVDKAEEEIELANQVNHLAVKQLASIANKQQARLIHISTDYVFDGESDKPYIETDTTNPINVYGKTKLAGEKSLQEVMPTNAIIIRSSWMYSEYPNNFLDTMLNIDKKNILKVVDDQIGSPTYTLDVANAILIIINSEKFGLSNKNISTQIYHYSNEGWCSWYGFARQIFKTIDMHRKVERVFTEQYLTTANRPKNTIMNKDKIKTIFGIFIPDWKDSLTECSAIIMKKNI
jgi:dTDP-4-dehydrorhamnose reductase